MKELIMSFFGHLSLSLFCIAVVISATQSHQKEKRWIVPAIWFKWLAVLVFGITGIYGFFMHSFFLEKVAKAYGLKPSPFQLELALCNLAFGVLGVLSYKNDLSFRKATTLCAFIYWFGAAILETSEMIKMNKFSLPYSMSWYAMDIVLPILLITFYILSTKQSGRKNKLWFR